MMAKRIDSRSVKNNRARRTVSALALAIAGGPLLLVAGCGQKAEAQGAQAVVVQPAGPYEAALNAYREGLTKDGAESQIDLAIDLLRRAAQASDVRAKKALGDIYSGHDEIGDPFSGNSIDTRRQPNPTSKRDDVEALKWYTLAAYHSFPRFYQATPADVNARVLAAERLPDIRARMRASDVRKAEDRVSETLQRGSAFDIYQLGRMYQRGDGLPKDNVQALTMYLVANRRGGVAEATAAENALSNLDAGLMTKKEVERAEELSLNWQPPLPEEHRGDTPQTAETKRLLAEYEAVRLEEAYQAISDIDTELVQRALRALGFYSGTIDNTTGPQTRDAIRRFQYSIVASDTELSELDREAVRTGVLSPTQTVELFRRAAGSGHTMSQYVYGIMHVQEIGVTRDGAVAVQWLARAAEKDLAIAHYALGVIYREGTTGRNPVTPNKAVAARHLMRAKILGYAPAGKALDDLEFEAPFEMGQ